MIFLQIFTFVNNAIWLFIMFVLAIAAGLFSAVALVLSKLIKIIANYMIVSVDDLLIKTNSDQELN